MQFQQIIGQQLLKQQLAQTIYSQKVAHAQLFLGNLGHGGLALALAYAQMLNCENPSETDSCGQCSSCQKSQKYIHPDIHFSYPFPSTINKDDKITVASELATYWRKQLSTSTYFNIHHWMQQFDSENRQPNIPVKECHDIIRRLNLKSYESRYKVMLIWLPEYLGKEGNTLLKVLEEPPVDTVFILVAENQENILSTILSRTQIIKVRNIEIDLLAEELTSHHEVDAENALNIASLSNGDYLEALELLKNEADTAAMAFMQWVQLCLPPQISSNNNQVSEVLKFTDAFAAMNKESQKSVMLYGLHLLQKIFSIHLTGKTGSLNNSEQQFVKAFSSKITIQNIEPLNKLFSNTLFYLERNANVKLLITNTSLRLSKILNNIAVNEIVASQ